MHNILERTCWLRRGGGASGDERQGRILAGCGFTRQMFGRMSGPDTEQGESDERPSTHRKHTESTQRRGGGADGRMSRRPPAVSPYKVGITPSLMRGVLTNRPGRISVPLTIVEVSPSNRSESWWSYCVRTALGRVVHRTSSDIGNAGPISLSGSLRKYIMHNGSAVAQRSSFWLINVGVMYFILGDDMPFGGVFITMTLLANAVLSRPVIDVQPPLTVWIKSILTATATPWLAPGCMILKVPLT